MGVFKATKNRKDKEEETQGGTFKATKNKSYDASMVQEWEKSNKESVAALNAFAEKSNNNEYLSSDDLDAYRKALDSYIESSNNLRWITKSLGGTLEDDDATWESNIASMNSTYEETKKHYAKWKDADAYKKAIADMEESKKQREALENYDFEAGKEAIRLLESDFNAIESVERQISAITAENQTLNMAKAKGSRDAIAKLEENQKRLDVLNKALEDAFAKYGSKDELSHQISEKNRQYTLASRMQKAKELASVVGNEDFEENSRYESTVTYNRTAWDEFLNNPARLEFDDATYEAINGNEDVRAYIAREDQVYSSDNPFDDGKDWFEESNYAHMNEAEIAIYNYYYNTEGKEKAEEFLDSIQETLNYRSAEKQFGGLINKPFLEMVFGIEAGLDQFVTGIDSLFSNADYIPASDTQILSGMVREDLAQTGAKLPDWLGGASLGQMGYDAITTTSNMLPSIMVSFIPVVGQAAGAVTLGASAAGHAKAEMLNLGYSKSQANLYGAMVGASEAGLQYLLGGITKLGGKAPQGLTKLALSKVDNALARVAISLGMNMASEGLEESLQTVIEPWLKSLVTGVDFEAPGIDEVLYSGLLGAVTSLFMEGGTTIAGEVGIRNQGANLKSGEQGAKNVEALVGLGKDFAEGTVANRLANSINENSSAYTIGRLLTEVGGSLSERNMADIASELQAKGMSLEAANATAKWLYKAVEGGHFNKRQQEAYVNDDRIADVHRDLFTNKENSVNKRNATYKALYDLAKEVHKVDDAAKATTKDDPVATKASAQQAETVSATENALGKEIATEGKFEASVEGKTIVKETGKEVGIAEIVSNEGGNLMVKLDNGETVNARDLAFATADEGLLYEMVANMGVNPKTATALVKAYDPASGVKAQTYAIDIPLAYQYGKIGYQKGLEKLNLTAEQSATAYVLGRDDVNASGRTWSDTSRKTPETNRAKAADDGTIYEGFELNEDSLTDIQKASLAGIRTLAKMSPSLEIHIYESVVENGKKYAVVNGKKVLAPNGFFRNGNEIYIDINAGKGTMGAMLYTASHEIVHFIAENSFEDFQTLADFLFEHYGENNVPVDQLIKREVDKLKKDYAAKNKELPSEPVLYMKAYEEVVANAMSKMLADPTSYEKLAKLKSENLAFWEKIGEAIKHLIDKLKSLLGIYEGRTPDQMAAHYVDDFSTEVYNKLQDLYLKGFVNAEENYEASIGSRKLADFEAAKNTEGDTLLQYKAMENDEDTYREMLKKWGKMTDSQISNLFLTIDNAMELIKDNLEALDYAWEADIDDRAFSPVKPNSDKLYQVSLDFSTLCRKRILQQTVQAQLQEALNKPLSREEGIAIRDALIAIQEEGRQIEVACALCYVESARMKSPEQIKKFMENKEAVIKEFFAGKSGGSMKEKLKKAETDAREKLHKENPDGIKGKDGSTMLDPRTAALKALPKKYADEIRSAKKEAKASYAPTAEEQRLIDVAKGMTVSDFTSPEGLENLAKNYRDLFDAYTSYVRNATKSKGIESDTWWRAGDSMQIGDVLIANMNKENGLRSQSWSDFQVIHILDYIAATIELATRNTKEQAYTKVPDFAELMGNTGVMINLSLIPTAKFNGKLEYDSVEGIDYKRSLELRDKYHATVGTICIGVDNVQIQMLLGDMTVDYVIPYHKSGMAAHIRKAMHIPTWTEYESYQSEKNLSRSDAKKQADKYGVKLLAENDPNYQKGTSFSEWFDIKEAQQIAKIENANPSDKAKQKKYGVMYGGYMAMQNAANNYLKLCTERGIAPKFSHEKADFTAEDNYWKLLIDRKMVDNVTGEVIEQQTIKPIFDEAEVMRILNDELERYPKVKADQEYAIRKVTEAYLSGDLKGGMSAEAIAKVMQTPVDNVTTTNIIASAEGDILYSVDEDFYDEFDAWDQKNPNVTFTVGTTSDVLKSIGMKDQEIKLHSGTVLNKVNKHPEISFDTFRDIPELLEHPIIVQFSDAIDPITKKQKYESRISVLGELNADNGKPVLVSLELLPKNQKKTTILDISVIVSAYAKDALQNYLNENSILYIDPNKKRTNNWLSLNRLQLPVGENQRGSIRIISYVDGKVKVQNKKNMTPMELALRKAGIIDDFGNLIENSDEVHSSQDPDSVSTRSLLANALETTAQNDIERDKLEQYKSKIELIEAEQEKLSKIRAEIKDLSFPKKGTKKDTARINSLRTEANRVANRINTYDRQLLNLESTTALKNVLAREKNLAYKRAEQRGKEALAQYREKAAKDQRALKDKYIESRKKAIESRGKTEMRLKIRKVVRELNTLLLNPTKDKHVPIGLQESVAAALDIINMDTVGADDRVAKYDALIAKEKDPAMKAELTRSRDRIKSQDDNLADKLTALKGAYAEIKNSDDPLVRRSHNEDIEDLIASTAKDVGDTSLRDMSYGQLESVYEMFKAIKATVRNANKLFAEDRQATISDNSRSVALEVSAAGGHRDRVLKATKWLKKFGWNMLKPIYAMKMIGSETLTRLYENVRKGEDTWAVDVNEARMFFKETANKYGYNSWDFKRRYSFKDNVGNSFSLSLEQIMSLYAYSKREKADRHLEVGGFIFDDAIEVVEKSKLGIPMRYEVNDANPYRLNREDLGRVIGILDTDLKQVKGFVDEMQAYLSDVMGAKGNEVSLAMYDIKLFKERNYFPLKTSRYFREFDAEQSANPNLKNSGFSKKTIPQAGNPIVLSNFMDVWAKHVNDMSMYHSFVLPLEDFMRVYNYSSMQGGYDSVQKHIKNAYGAQANEYIETLMNDLNGGARTDPATDVLGKGISLFKKGAVFASASVVVQQPSAIARAMAYLNAKYFVDKPSITKHSETWAEVKKYAPVAIIKEIGYFDTGMGQSTVEWIKGDKSLRDKIDDVASKAPALADELAWCCIWKAVKREVEDTSNLVEGTEAFLRLAGERFTEIITRTQVYDSVLSRSALMRSKDTGMRMATAFMAEPTTSLNMVVDAIIEGRRGDKRFARKAIGAVAASIILNSILVSLVYAARDDDEDETYVEKYLESLTTEVIDGFNPITYIPFAKDIWSIAQGFDVERSDMSIVGDLWESIENLFSNNKSGFEKVEGVAGSVAALFGMPLKNVLRDVKGVYNLITNLLSDTPTTKTGVIDAVGDAVANAIPLYSRIEKLVGADESKSDKLYEAIISGDQAHIDRVKSQYKDNKDLASAIRKALRENDPRIIEAVMAFYEGNHKQRQSLTLEVEKEGNFSTAIVRGAINNEIQYLKNKIKDAKAAKRKGDTEEFDKIVEKLCERYPKDFVEDLFE